MNKKVRTALVQAEKQFVRNLALAEQGFAAALRRHKRQASPLLSQFATGGGRKARAAALRTLLRKRTTGKVLRARDFIFIRK